MVTSMQYTISDSNGTALTLLNSASSDNYGLFDSSQIVSLSTLQITSNSLYSHSLCIDTILSINAPSLLSEVGSVENFYSLDYDVYETDILLYDYWDNSYTGITMVPYSNTFGKSQHVRCVPDPISPYGNLNLVEWFNTSPTLMISDSVLVTDRYFEISNLSDQLTPYRLIYQHFTVTGHDSTGNLILSTGIVYEELSPNSLYQNTIIDTSIIGVGLQFYDSTVSMFLNTMQFMGYTYSQPTLTVPSSTIIYVPTGTTTVTSITTTLTYSYTIDNQVIVADNFVIQGIYVDLVGNAPPTLLVSETELSFELTQYSDTYDSLIGTSDQVTVEIFDQRNPDQISSLVLTYYFQAACVEADFVSVSLQDIFLDQTSYTIIIGNYTGSAVVDYTVPSCAGYIDTWIDVSITMPTGTRLTNQATDLTLFDDCLLTEADCFYLDPVFGVFQWNVRAATFAGTSTFEFTATHNYYTGVDATDTSSYTTNTTSVSFYAYIPCINATIPTTITATVGNYANYQVTSSQQVWTTTSPITMTTQYLAYNAATSTTGVQIDIVYSSPSSSSTDPLCTVSESNYYYTSTTQAYDLVKNATTKSLYLYTGDKQLRAITHSELITTTPAHFEFVVSVATQVLTNYTGTIPSSTFHYYVVVNNCVPYSTTFQVASTDLSNYNFVYYRQNTTQSETITMNLLPACDDLTGNITITSLYSITASISGSVLTLTFSQPTSTDVDSVQQITLLYSHLTYSKTYSFTVQYISGIPTIITPSSSDIYVPSGTTTLTSTLTSISYNYTVGGILFTTNDTFVIAGIQASVSGNVVPFVTLSSTALSLTLTQYSNQSAYIDQTVTLTVFDFRKPSEISTLTLTYKFRAACLAQDVLLGLQLDQTSYSIYIGYSGSAVITYTAPTCAGYIETIIIVNIMLPSGSVLSDIATDLATYNACVQDCFYIDPLLNTFQWSVQSQTYTGLNTVYFTPVHYYYTGLSDTETANTNGTISSIPFTGYCVPNSADFTVSDVNLQNYNFVYYRSNLTQQSTITLVISPSCTQYAGNVTITSSAYTIVPALVGTLSYDLTLSQPPSSDADSIEQVTLQYQYLLYTTSVTFNVKYTNCANTVLRPTQLDAVNVSLSNETYQFDYTQFQDTFSLQQGNKDGLTQCGERNVSVNTTLYPFIALQYNDTDFTINVTTDYIWLGGYSIPIQVYLVDFPTVTYTQNLVLNIYEPDGDLFNSTAYYDYYIQYFWAYNETVDITNVTDVAIAMQSDVTEGKYILLKEMPAEPPLITCAGTQSFKDWSYKLPDASFNGTSYKLFSVQLHSLLVFKQPTIKLNQNLKTINLTSGDYGLSVTVTTKYRTEVYQILFKYECSTPLSADDLLPPVPSVQSVDQKGKILINWSKTMFIDAQGVISEGSNKNRQLKEEESVSVKLISGSNGTELELPYSFVLKWINSRQIEMDVKFDYPELISNSKSMRDYLQIALNNQTMFKSVKDVQIDHGLTFNISLPRQLATGAVVIELAGATTVGAAALGTSFAASFVMKAVLNQLLGLVESLSIITHMFLLSLDYPVNVQSFFANLFPLISFNLIPLDIINEGVLQISEVDDHAMTEQFDAVGYGSVLIVNNLGDIYYVVILAPVIVIILFILICAIKCSLCVRFRCGRAIRDYLQFQYDGFFYNGTIQFLYSGYLVTCVSTLISLQNIDFNEWQRYLWQQKLCVCSTLLFAAIVTAFPIIILILYCTKIKTVNPLPNLNDLMSVEELQQTYGTLDIAQIQRKAYTKDKKMLFMNKYGALVEGLNGKKIGKRAYIAIPVASMVRQYILALSIVMFVNTPQLAVMSFTFSSQLALMLEFYNLPRKNRAEQKVTLFNEITVMITNYHLFLLTDFTDVSTQTVTGNSVIYFTCGNVVLNLITIFVPLLLQALKRLKRKWLHRQMRRKSKVTKVQEVEVVEVEVTNNKSAENTELEVREPQNLIGQNKFRKGAGKRNLIVMQRALSRISEESSLHLGSLQLSSQQPKSRLQELSSLHLGSLQLSSQQPFRVQHEYSESAPSIDINQSLGDDSQLEESQQQSQLVLEYSFGE